MASDADIADDGPDAWLKRVPYDTRQGAVKELIGAYKSAFALKRGGAHQELPDAFQEKKGHPAGVPLSGERLQCRRQSHLQNAAREERREAQDATKGPDKAVGPKRRRGGTLRLRRSEDTPRRLVHLPAPETEGGSGAGVRKRGLQVGVHRPRRQDVRDLLLARGDLREGRRSVLRVLFRRSGEEGGQADFPAYVKGEAREIANRAEPKASLSGATEQDRAQGGRPALEDMCVPDDGVSEDIHPQVRRQGHGPENVPSERQKTGDRMRDDAEDVGTLAWAVLGTTSILCENQAQGCTHRAGVIHDDDVRCLWGP